MTHLGAPNWLLLLAKGDWFVYFRREKAVILDCFVKIIQDLGDQSQCMFTNTEMVSICTTERILEVRQ